MRPEVGSNARQRAAVRDLNEIVARLAAAELDEFDAVLLEIFRSVAPVLDAVAVGESTAHNQGIVWFDESVVSQDEIDDLADRLRALGDATGPTTMRAPNGRRVMAAPARSAGWSRYTAAALAADAVPDLDQIAFLEALSTVVGTARQRVVAERELRQRATRQEMLNELYEMAATAVPSHETLDAMLDRVRDAMGISAVSTLVRDGDEFVLVASTDVNGRRPVPIGTRSTDSVATLLEEAGAGHVVRPLTDFVGTPEALADTHGEVLVVPRYVGSDVAGVVVFTDLDGRHWSDAEIEFARSVAWSIQKLTLRTDLERANRRRHELDKMLSAVATVAARASLENLDEVVDETLRIAIEGLGLRRASIWSCSEDTAHRLASRAASGERTDELLSFPFDADARRHLVETGSAYVPVDSVEFTGEVLERDGMVLVVPIGIEPSGLAVFAHGDLPWGDDEVAAAKALASLAEQTRVRLEAEVAVHDRLRDEALISAVAAAAIDATPANVDERLDAILSLIQQHFGVVEASVWRIEGDQLWCRAAVRGDDRPSVAGWTVPMPPDTSLRADGWAVLRVRDLDLADNRDGEARRVSDDTKLLVVGYGSATELIGAVALADTRGRWWRDEDIATLRSVGAIIGQLRFRLDYARRLERQRSIESLLADTAGRFVHATLDDAQEVVDEALEEVRARLDLASVTVLALDHETLQLDVQCEVTDDGLALLEKLMPIPRDAPSIARILDPAAPTRWALTDLFPGAPERGGALVFPAVRDRDLLVVVATVRPGAEFGEDVEASMLSMVGSLAQLRRRLLLEHQSRRRSEADQLLGVIARSFVEQPPHDHNDAVGAALARIGEFFGHLDIGQWLVQGDGSVQRVLGWRAPGSPFDGTDEVGVMPADHPFARLLATAGDSDAIELGVYTPMPDLARQTMLIQRFSYDDYHCGIAALVGRPRHQIIDLELQLDVLESVARLIEQLWRRAEADLRVARQLRNEDRLRRFATHLVTADADAPDGLATAFAAAVAAVRVDHATIWHFARGEEGFEVTAALHVARDAVRELEPRFRSFALPANFVTAEREPFLVGPTTQWPLDEVPERLREMLSATVPPGPRRVALLVAPGTDIGSEGSYLVVSRPGARPFRDDELEFLRSAHSILIQHEARVAAERYFGAAFNSAPIGITLRDADMTLIHCNAAYCELVGRSIEELVGTDLYEVMPADMAVEMSNLFSDGEDGIREAEASYRRPDGAVRWASVRSTPIRIPGRSGPLYLTYVEDITERRRNREMLEYQATHDELSGLPNRRALVAKIAAELQAGADCAVLVLDLDRFKVVNDSLGHSVGDQLLITCADRIRLSLRPGDSVCRLGGDEFAILLRAPADAHAAGVVAERMLGLLREPVIIGDDEIYPSASIGVAIPQRGDGVEDLLRHADAAMYQAKGLGRDRWEIFDGSMRQAVVDRIRTETDLRRAIENGQLEVHYQPEFLLETGEIVGTEALVRWRHPERGLLAAGSFISLAEETGLVVDLGRWVLEQATRQGAAWLGAGYDIVTRVNLSARQLRGAVVTEVEDALRAAGLPASRLCLELTETAIMDDVQESARILARFRDLGVQVAIDDFGTGFSSLAYLKRFPVDILKIDRTFVDGVGVDPDDTAIVRSVIGLARTLRLEVVAEGIEDAAQVAELVRLGCGRGQGFHLARPAPSDDVSMLLAGSSPARSE